MNSSYFRYSSMSSKDPEEAPSASPSSNASDNLFVANLNTTSLEELVSIKLEHFFKNEEAFKVEDLYKLVKNQFEKPLIKLAFENCRRNQLKTANLLGLSRNTLKKKLEEYDLSN